MKEISKLEIIYFIKKIHIRTLWIMKMVLITQTKIPIILYKVINKKIKIKINKIVQISKMKIKKNRKKKKSKKKVEIIVLHKNVI